MQKDESMGRSEWSRIVSFFTLTLLAAIGSEINTSPLLTDPFFLLSCLFSLQGCVFISSRAFHWNDRTESIVELFLVLAKFGVAVHIFCFGIMVPAVDYVFAAVSLLFWVAVSGWLISSGIGTLRDVVFSVWDKIAEKRKQAEIARDRLEAIQREQEISDDLANYLARVDYE